MTTARRHFGTEPSMTDDQLAVATLLSDCGPIPGAIAADVLGWTAERWWEAVGKSDAWFDLTGKGWTLTAAGRIASG
jgi:hypothetical protein